VPTAEIAVNGIAMHYRIDGTHGPWVLFSNSLLTDLSIWDDQAAALSDRYRVLRYDHRGHGRTEASAGPYSFTQLADDAIGLLDALSIEQAHIVGISIGGNTGAVLANRHPERVRSLTMCDCQPRSNPVSEAAWRERLETARSSGLAPIVDSALQRWFDPDFLERDPATADRLRAMMAATSVEGYRGCVSALLRYDLRATITALRTPALLLAGEQDGNAPEVLTALSASMLQARFQAVPDAGHISCVDGAKSVTAALSAFLDEQSPAPETNG
jgi:3-oxoadipate enol-lactonase